MGGRVGGRVAVTWRVVRGRGCGGREAWALAWCVACGGRVVRRGVWGLVGGCWGARATVEVSVACIGWCDGRGGWTLAQCMACGRCGAGAVP